MPSPPPQPPLVSVIICAHNPRSDYLQAVLAALRTQTLPLPQWELLLVDNASAAPLASAVDLSWHPQARHLHEAHLGLSWARFRGIGEARGDLLVFVDDDNVLDPDYLEGASGLAGEWPMLGAWGGQTRGRFEAEPPDWTRSRWPNLGVNCETLAGDCWGRFPGGYQALPCGAGMCARRKVAALWAENARQDPLQAALGRTGKSLLSCEDTLLALTAWDLGLGTGIFTRLKLTHLIPSARLTEEYLLRLEEGIAFSGIVMRWLRGERDVQPLKTLGQRVLTWYAALRLAPRERRFFLARVRAQAAGWRFLRAYEKEANADPANLAARSLSRLR